MKILLSAHACNPESTSECVVGWRCLLAVASRHEVWLLTAERNREALERARENGSLPKNVHLNYAGRDFQKSRNPMMAKIREWPYYSSFLKAARPIAQRLHRKVGFDLVHHATFATWRVPVPYGELGIPFVIGPIGGGEIFNLSFSGWLSWQARIFEWFRNCATIAALVNPKICSTFRRTSIVLSANEETSAIVAKFVRGKKRIHSLLVTSFTEDSIRMHQAHEDKNYEGTLLMAGGGTCEGRKGVLVVLQALQSIKKQDISFHYTFAGSGPETEYLIKKRDAMGLTREVDILPNLSKEKYQQHLQRTHVYLLPSLRDNSPVALMEAMLAGCVPVVAACNGPAVIVNDRCGYSLPAGSPGELIQHIERTILALHHDRTRLAALGNGARLRIANDFNHSSYGETIENAYKAAIGNP